MTNSEIESKVSAGTSKSVENQTDMTYWDMSRYSYRDIEQLTNGKFTNPEDFTTRPYSFYVDVSPTETEKWDIVKALDDKETDTQALAFKKDDQIVISYRGSQEL